MRAGGGGEGLSPHSSLPTDKSSTRRRQVFALSPAPVVAPALKGGTAPYGFVMCPAAMNSLSIRVER